MIRIQFKKKGIQCLLYSNYLWFTGSVFSCALLAPPGGGVEGGTTLPAPLDGLECCTLLPLGEVEAGSTLYIFLRAGSATVRTDVKM